MKKLHLLIGFVFVVMSHVVFAQVEYGNASYYGDKFHGKKTANGEKFDKNAMTAAHRTLEFGTKVRVTNQDNGESIIVRINDRGPHVDGRIIDLSEGAARRIGMIESGTASVKIEVMGKAGGGEEIPIHDGEELVGGNWSSYGGDYYKLDIYLHPDPQGYAIQVGSYLASKYLVELIEKLNEITNKSIVMQVAIVDNQRYYRVLLSHFCSEKEAREYMDTICDQISEFSNGEAPACFVVRL